MKKVSLAFIFAFGFLTGIAQKCPMTVDKWQVVQKGADVNTQTKVLTELIAAADGDIAKVKEIINSGTASGKLNLKWELSRQANKKKYRSYQYNQVIWEDMKLAQQAYCALYAEIKQGFYNTPESYKKALDQLETTRNYLLSAKKKLQS